MQLRLASFGGNPADARYLRMLVAFDIMENEDGPVARRELSDGSIKLKPGNRRRLRLSLRAFNFRLRREDANGEKQVVISVRDYGTGVPEEAIDKIFRPFYRVEDARDRQTGGTGLGLAIAAHAVRLHGGTIKAANAPDGGLVVEIRLPAGS